MNRERVAVLEWNGHGDFQKLREFCLPEEPPAACFRILEVDYYAAADAAALAGCLQRDYGRILIDYGEACVENCFECLRCDRSVMIGALAEWRAGAFLEAVGRGTERGQSWSYAVSSGNEETRREVEKAFRIVCRRIPASADAFAVTRPDIEFFRDFLGM